MGAGDDQSRLIAGEAGIIPDGGETGDQRRVQPVVAQKFAQLFHTLFHALIPVLPAKSYPKCHCIIPWCFTYHKSFFPGPLSSSRRASRSFSTAFFSIREM